MDTEEGGGAEATPAPSSTASGVSRFRKCMTPSSSVTFISFELMFELD